MLDEPTNHLDLATKEMLVAALKDFEGTMIFVSHDRMFLRGLGSRVLELGGESGTDPRGRTLSTCSRLDMRRRGSIREQLCNVPSGPVFFLISIFALYSLSELW